MGGMDGVAFEVPPEFVARWFPEGLPGASSSSAHKAMVQIDIPVAFGTGSLFAAAVEKGLRSERYGYFYQKALAVNLVFQLLLVVWLPVYLLIAHFGFQTSHMWWTGSSITEYPWLLPGFLLAYFVANIAGFHVGVRFVRQGRTRMPWLLFRRRLRLLRRVDGLSAVPDADARHLCGMGSARGAVDLDRPRLRGVADWGRWSCSSSRSAFVYRKRCSGSGGQRE